MAVRFFKDFNPIPAAQKSRSGLFFLRIGLTQMDISSIKDNPMAELAQQHKQAQIELHKMEKKDLLFEWRSSKNQFGCFGDEN